MSCGCEERRVKIKRALEAATDYVLDRHPAQVKVVEDTEDEDAAES